MGRYGLIHPTDGSYHVFSTVVMDTIAGPLSGEQYANDFPQLGPAMTLEQADAQGHAGPERWYAPGAWPVVTFSISDLIAAGDFEQAKRLKSLE